MKCPECNGEGKVESSVVAHVCAGVAVDEQVYERKCLMCDSTGVSQTEKSPETLKQLEGFGHAFKAAVESNINAYEEACAKYIDNKYDRKRFKKIYQISLRQLVENPQHKPYFDGVTSRYKAILKVYSEWENPER